MEGTWQSENVFLGRGGSSPGVSVYDIETCEISHMLSLPDRQSVYALALSPDGRRLAAGTRGGLLHHACNSVPSGDDDGIGIRKITHGFPILSMCFLDRDTVAVSDIVGRCLAWHLEGTPQARQLPTGGSVVCSLFRLAADRLAALTLGGRLLVWQWLTGEILLDRPVPVPPDLCALVKPAYWASADVWVWASQKGLAAMYDAGRDDVKTVRAHDSELYALAPCHDELLTVGRDDGTLKRWRYDGSAPVGRCGAPRGAIAMTAWADPEPKIILADDRGTAGVYDLAGGTLRFISGLNGRDFRVILGPDQGRLAASLRQRRMQQAQEITDRIRENHADRGSEQVEQLHEQLIALGYEHQSLALRAEAARRDDDMVSELKYSRQAVALVSEKEPGAYGFLVRHAALLESVWQLRAARDLCGRLVQEYPGEALHERLQHLEGYLTAMEKGDYVIESDLSLRLLAQSACVMETPFCGRHLLGQDTPISTGVPGISASILIAEYQQLCAESPGVPLPSAYEAMLWWFSRARLERVRMVLFDGGESSPIPGLEFGIKLYDAGLQTVLVPVALFNADVGSENASPAEHNRNVSRLLDKLDTRAVRTGWLRSIKALTDRAAQIVINKKRQRTAQCPEVNYGIVTTEDPSGEDVESSANVFDGPCTADRRTW